jgi:hypothetical protein
MRRHQPPNACRGAVAVAVTVAGMVGCLIPLSTAASNVIGVRPQLGCAFLSIPVPAGCHFSESAEFRGISGFRRNTRWN